jgi:hypothetical protein
MGTQLHEILAVNNDLSVKANTLINETINTFKNKKEHFEGIQKIYKAFDDEDNDLIPPEEKRIVETVKDKINYTAKSIIDNIDVELTKNETNLLAKAELTIIDDKQLVSYNFGKFSVSSLMDLEKQLTNIRKLYLSIPTLDNTKEWIPSKQDLKEIYKTSEAEIKYRTKQIPKSFIRAEATKEHKAQVDVYNETIQVGKYETTYKSGKISSEDKATLINRIDILLIAIKKAKSKANQQIIEQKTIGQELFDFINDGILK